MPVGYMLRIMSSAELTEWMAFYKVKQEEAEEKNDRNVWRPPESE